MFGELPAISGGQSNSENSEIVSTEYSAFDGDFLEVLDNIEDEDPFFRIPKYLLYSGSQSASFLSFQVYSFAIIVADSLPSFLQTCILTNAP